MPVRFILALVAVLVPAGALLAGNPSHKHRHGDGHSVSINADSEKDVLDCSDIEVEFSDREALRSEDRMEIPASGTLQVMLEQRGGIRVQGSTGANYGVRLCKAISPQYANQAAAMFSRIRATLEGRTLKVTGPSDADGWIGYLLVDAPGGASTRIEATNAPISLRNVSGNVAATAINGPISVKGSAGVIEAKTTNGPISFAGSEGEVNLTAVNGPVTVKLDGGAWNGRGLTASTANGPVSLALPDGYRSAVEVTGGHGPWSCKGEICSEVVRTDAELKSMTIGAGAPLVRLSTRNGPVSIKSR